MKYCQEGVLSVEEAAKHNKTQVFTPDDIASDMVEKLQLSSMDVNSTFLENSCGSGNLLVALVRTLIDEFRRRGLSDSEISQRLGKQITAYELDPSWMLHCAKRLGEVVAQYQLPEVHWNLIVGDWLQAYVTNKNTYDYIISNPPYQTYNEMSEENRNYLHENFQSCKTGKFDYCYAFIEASLNSLSSKGTLSIVFPSSFFKTVFGANLRSQLLPYLHSIEELTRYPFSDALVAAAIVVCSKEEGFDSFNYSDQETKSERIIKKDNLDSEKWIFLSSEKDSTVYKSPRKFGDLFNVTMPVATLANRVFLLPDAKLNGDYYVVDNFKIERAIVRPAASPRGLKYGASEFIVYPYKYEHKKLIKYDKGEFNTLFEGAVAYLKRANDILEKRDSDKGANWFEYGRSQAIERVNYPKLMLSSVITSTVNVYSLNSETIPYAGLMITEKPNSPSLSVGQKILQSEDFLNYVKSVGVRLNGSSIRITVKDIRNYPVPHSAS